MRRFLREIDDIPEVSKGSQSRTYAFKRLGFELVYDLRMNKIWLISIVRGGSDGFGECFENFEQFQGSLMNGITLADRRDDVRRKLGITPIASGHDPQPVNVPLNLSGDKLDAWALQRAAEIASSTVPYPVEWDSYLLSPFKVTFRFNSLAEGKMFEASVSRY